MFVLTIQAPQDLRQLKISKTPVDIKNCFLHVFDMKEI